MDKDKDVEKGASASEEVVRAEDKPDRQDSAAGQDKEEKEQDSLSTGNSESTASIPGEDSVGTPTPR